LTPSAAPVYLLSVSFHSNHPLKRGAYALSLCLCSSREWSTVLCLQHIGMGQHE